MKAYWFSDNGKPQFGSTVYEVRDEPYVQGGEIIPCQNGLHASAEPFDALCYAWGNTLDIVELSGTVVHHRDKFAASHRKHIKRIDAGPILREFARWCALQVVDKWECPPVVRQYLETGDESIREAARDAADAAAKAASRPIVRNAATDVAWAAAWSASVAARTDTARAMATAKEAAKNAAVAVFPRNAWLSNARYATWYATTENQRKKFNEMIEEAFAQAD